MNNEMLSQEEIDALLRSQFNSDEVKSSDDYLTPIEIDALGEIGNITFGNASTALSTLLGQKVEITTPKVFVIDYDQLAQEFPAPHVAVHVNYTEGFKGINLLVIKTEDAKIIADLMLGGDGTNIGQELGELHISAVQEAMNQMMGSAATSMSTIFNTMVNISPPGINILDLISGEGIEYIPKSDKIVLISFRLKIGSLIDSKIMQILPINFAKELANNLMKNIIEKSNNERPNNIEENLTSTNKLENVEKDDSVVRKLNNNINENEKTTKPKPINVQSVQFSSFETPNYHKKDDNNFDILMDIPLQVTVELGRTKKYIKEILELTSGSIIELDKLAGEPVDVYVNQKLIAKGEVVVIDENFGVRITEIVNKNDKNKVK